MSGLSEERLKDELAELASHLYAGTCRWLGLVGELDRRCGYADFGHGSCAEYIAWRCALSPRAAREHVRVARRLGELPLIHAAFARGELSYAKVRALTRVADERSESELVELAECMTAAQLDRAVGAYRRVSVLEAREAQEDAYLTWFWDEDGCLVVRGRLAPEEGALFLRGLEAARDALYERKEGEGRGPAGPRRPKNVEAVAALAEAMLARGPGERSGGERYQVVVHVDANALSSEESDGCQLEDGPALAAETVRRIACDASLVRSLEADGEPLSVGRKTRAVPSSLRRALRRRDGRCRFPGCENGLFLDAHHVEHWAHGGETSVENLLLLCRRHHRLVHEGGYSVEYLSGDRACFSDPWGNPVPAVPRPPPGSCDRLVDPNHRANLGIDAETCRSGDNDPMDLSLAVDALLAIAGR